MASNLSYETLTKEDIQKIKTAAENLYPVELLGWEATATSETAPEWEGDTTEEALEKPQTLSSTVPDQIWLEEAQEKIAKRKLSNQTQDLVNQAKRAPKTFAQVKAKQIAEAYLAKVTTLSPEEKEIIRLNAQNIVVDLTDRLL